MSKCKNTVLRLLALVVVMSLFSFVSIPVSATVDNKASTGDYPEIKLGNTVTVNIKTEEEIAYLKFVPETDMTVCFYSVGDDDTYGYLYDENMDEIKTSDDDGTGSNFKINYRVSAGQLYYFGVKYYSDTTGSITVVLEQGSDWEYVTYDDGTATIEGYNGSSTELIIPDTIDGCTVTDIGWAAFRGNTNLTSVVIPEGITQIGSQAFRNCTNLSQVTIPESVKQIDNDAFSQCTNLSHVTLPKSIERVGNDAFAETPWYNALYEAHPDGVVYIGKTAYAYKGSVPKTLEIKPGTVMINEFLLDNNEENVNLKNLIMPDSVIEIGQHAFNGCIGLTSLDLPDGLESLSWCAFMHCTGLTSVTIPANVSYFSSGVFAGCTNLKSIIVDSGNPYYDSRENCNAVISTSGNRLVQGCSSTVIPSSVETIGDYAFWYCEGLTEILIPDCVKTIGENAFSGCTNLKSIVIPDSVMKINKSAFSYCESLSSITLSDSVTYIGEDAFYGCSSLKNIEIPPFVTEIGEEAFGYDQGWESSERMEDFVITGYSGTTAETYAGDNHFTFISLGEPPSLNPEFIQLDEPLTVRIVNGGDTVRLKFIPDRDMRAVFTATTTDNEDTRGFLYNSEMEVIGVAYGSDKEGSLKLFGSLNAGETYYYEVSFNSDWDTGSFKVLLTEAPVWEHDENTITHYNGTDSKVVIPANLDGFEITTIGLGAFKNHNELTEITIGNNITGIEDSAFYGCPNLKSVTIPSTVSEIYSEAFGYSNDWWSGKVPGFTIYGYSNTAAQRYANENDFTFVCLDPAKAGDANGDGAVTSVDVTYIQRYCSKLEMDVDEDTIMNADVDRNGILEIIDATLIQRYLAGMEIPFEIG